MSQIALLIPLLLICATSLAELYDYAERFIAPGWLAAAAVNTVLAFGFLVFCKVRHFPIRPAAATTKLRPFHFYLPSVILLVVIAVAGFISRMTGAATSAEIGATQLLWVLWIPVIEEVVFRGGFSKLFGRLGGRFWGSYFAIALFSLVHSHPTLTNMLHLQIGLPVGPLLLGAACEVLCFYSGRLLPAIAFHSVCNASVVVFSLLDSRWLHWLGFLYSDA